MERPILFSGPMVRAILAGNKTQTRRVVKPQPNSGPNGRLVDLLGGSWGLLDGDLSGEWRCPYGRPGDRLWVRETWHGCFMMNCESVSVITSCHVTGHPFGRVEHYAADGEPGHLAGKARPSIHMPRWASRILLEITDVRVQRVREINEADAIAEGAPDYEESRDAPPIDPMCEWSYRASFQRLWDSINAKRGFGWHENPWVWALTFKRVTEAAK